MSVTTIFYLIVLALPTIFYFVLRSIFEKSKKIIALCAVLVATVVGCVLSFLILRSCRDFGCIAVFYVWGVYGVQFIGFLFKFAYEIDKETSTKVIVSEVKAQNINTENASLSNGESGSGSKFLPLTILIVLAFLIAIYSKYS